MNTVELKTINELEPYSFFIPSYQRGYRWTALEVNELLDDLNEFSPREIRGAENQKTWYCLQPIVLKKLSNEKCEYEVIDGQQRITTIYLILHYLNQDFVEKRRDKLFSIDYETRNESKEFLRHPEIENDEYIDYFFIHQAYSTIEKWFEAHESYSGFDKSEYRSKLKFHTKVIWYETDEDNPIAVFTRLNIGKISLTNAELIKALFLNSSNFRSEFQDRIRMRQIEIANEWDNIETALQNDKLWFFLNNEEKEDNRIEYIFNLMNDSGATDSYATFRYFSGRLVGSGEEALNSCWEEVQAYYQRFNEWFSQRELYHKIGFLLSTEIIANKNLVAMKKLYLQSISLKKQDFISWIDSAIRNAYRKLKLFDLEYDNKDTKNVLLLYNILTMLQNEHDESRFPFDTFKRDKWNVEHIASRKDPHSVPEKNRIDWLADVRAYIDVSQEEGAALIDEIDNMKKSETYIIDAQFSLLYDKITDHFNQHMRDFESIDGISNLALLDEKTNKGYKNAVFPLKRKYIIDRDKKGGFVPIGTKNVFLKYFSDYPPKVSFWTDEDRKNYETDLQRVLHDYIEVLNS